MHCVKRWGTIGLLLLVVSLVPVTTFASGGFRIFADPGLPVRSTEFTSVFVSYEDGQETLILQPGFLGAALDFVIVVPFFVEPEQIDVPEDFFDQLESSTAPETTFRYAAPPPLAADITLTPTPTPAKGPKIKVPDVSTYDVTLLPADSLETVATWITDNKYFYSRKDSSNFAHYVKDSGAFVAMIKVDATNVKPLGPGIIAGKLKPIGFRFPTSRPIVPMRISASSDQENHYVLYTMGNKMYFVPGADIEYSAEVTEDTRSEIPALDDVDPEGSWLVRHVVTFNPLLISEDLRFAEAAKGEEVPIDGGQYRFNGTKAPKNAGVILGRAEQVKEIPVVEQVEAPVTSTSPSPRPTKTVRPSPVSSVQNLPPTSKDSRWWLWPVAAISIVLEVILVGVLVYVRRRKMLREPEEKKKPDAIIFEAPKVEITSDFAPTAMIVNNPTVPVPKPAAESPPPTGGK